MIKVLKTLALCSLSTAALAQAPCTKPVVTCQVADQPVTSLMSAKLPATLRVQLAPAPKCPAAQYVPTKVEIILARGRHAITKTGVTIVAGADIDLSQWHTAAMPGDLFSIEVKEYDVVTATGKQHVVMTGRSENEALATSLPIK